MDNLYFSKNPIPVEAITADQSQPNFYFECSARVEDYAGILMGEVKQKGFPDAAGLFTFNLAPVADAYLQPDLPAYNAGLITEGVHSLMKIRTWIYKFWGEPVAGFKGGGFEGTRYALLGGLNYLAYPGHNFFTDRANKFLTFAPDQKLVSPLQQEYLYFLKDPAQWPEVYLHARVTRNNGGTLSRAAQLFTPITNPSVVIVPAGFYQLGLQSLWAEKEIVSYELWLSPTASSTDPNSTEKRTYLLDHSYRRDARYFLYLNSIGGFEVLRTTGEVKEEYSVAKEQGVRMQPYDYSGIEHQQFVHATEGQTSYKVNTGMAPSLAWYRHLKEFFASKQVYEITGSAFVPVVVQPGKFKLQESGNYELATDFTYQHAFTSGF